MRAKQRYVANLFAPKPKEKLVTTLGYRATQSHVDFVESMLRTAREIAKSDGDDLDKSDVMRGIVAIYKDIDDGLEKLKEDLAKVAVQYGLGKETDPEELWLGKVIVKATEIGLKELQKKGVKK